MRIRDRDGGYDDGYRECSCFWGKEPGSLVLRLFRQASHIPSRVLDLGCGEGKNASFFAERGATVDAVDCSSHALRNAAEACGGSTGVTWHLSDARDFLNQPRQPYDIVVMYGLLHCLPSLDDVLGLVDRARRLTTAGGLHILCAFNQRAQDLSAAHPTFAPLLLTHTTYVGAYEGWAVDASDEDLFEVHPHNRIPHRHSMTRLVARAPA
ncbi:MAG TPA: class I SAM-dependent methyltransferase [Acidimicrobiales bacterium]|nr:class I SAM-dependent methyltransferase [Acidimicrobiales bacterium]